MSEPQSTLTLAANSADSSVVARCSDILAAHAASVAAVQSECLAERRDLAALTKRLQELPADARPAAVPPVIKAFRAHVDRLQTRAVDAETRLAALAEHADRLRQLEANAVHLPQRIAQLERDVRLQTDLAERKAGVAKQLEGALLALQTHCDALLAEQADRAAELHTTQTRLHALEAELAAPRPAAVADNGNDDDVQALRDQVARLESERASSAALLNQALEDALRTERASHAQQLAAHDEQLKAAQAAVASLQADAELVQAKAAEQVRALEEALRTEQAKAVAELDRVVETERAARAAFEQALQAEQATNAASEHTTDRVHELERLLQAERSASALATAALETERKQLADVQKQLSDQFAASEQVFAEQRKTAAELTDARRAYDSMVDELQSARSKVKASVQAEQDAARTVVSVQEAAARAEERLLAARAEQLAAQQAMRDAEQRCDAATARLDSTERELRVASDRAEALRLQVLSADGKLDEVAAELARARKLLGDSVPRQQLLDLQEELAERDRELGALRERTAEVRAAELRADAAASELELAHNSIRAIDDARVVAEDRAREAADELVRLRAVVAALESAAANRDGSNDDAVVRLESENANLKERLDGAREANRTLQQELEAAQAKLLGLSNAAASASTATATVPVPPVPDASPELLSVMQRLTHEKAGLLQQLESEKRRCVDLEDQVLHLKHQVDELGTELSVVRRADRDLERGGAGAAALAADDLSCVHFPTIAANMWRRLTLMVARTLAARSGANAAIERSR
jgi:predicted  nucleic acid-binding Zn-ribbon protein